MGFPSFSAFPPVPQRSAPEADFDAKMYALFRHFADTHRNELLAFTAFLEANSTVIDGALNATTLGLTEPAAARVTTLEAERFTGGAVLGAVSQDAGVPTGALMERGSNANGAYVRFADGTQICSQQVYHTNTDVTTAAGSLYISARQTWTFPAAFDEPPNVVASGERSNDAIVSGVSIRNAPTVSASTYLFWLSSPAVAGSGSRSAFFTAIGRWF